MERKVALQIQHDNKWEQMLEISAKSGFRFVSMGFGSSKCFHNSDWETEIKKIRDKLDSLAGNMSNELIGKLGMKNLSKGVKVDVTEEHVSVSISMNIKYGFSIPTVCEKVQDKVKSAIENMTGLTVLDVNIKIAGVNVEEQ